MGYGFDDADAAETEAATVQSGADFDNITDPWVFPAPSTPTLILSACSSSSASVSAISPVKLQCHVAVLANGVSPESSPKRRKISCKTSSQDAGHGLSSSPDCAPVLPEKISAAEGDDCEANKILPDLQETLPPHLAARDPVVFPLQQFWMGWTPRKIYLWCWEKVRSFWSTLPSTKAKYGDANYRAIRQFWGTLSQTERTEVGLLFCKTFNAPVYVQQGVLQAFGWKDKDSKTYGKPYC